MKLPRSWPNSSLSMRLGETAPQLTGRNASLWRRLSPWIVSATSSLPVPVSPEQHHRGVGGRDLRDQVVHPLHRRRGADQGAEAAELAQLAAQVPDLLLQLAGAHHVGEHALHPRHVDGLDQVVGGALPQRLHRGVDAGLPGDEDDLGRGLVSRSLKSSSPLPSGRWRSMRTTSGGDLSISARASFRLCAVRVLKPSRPTTSDRPRMKLTSSSTRSA